MLFSNSFRRPVLFVFVLAIVGFLVAGCDVGGAKKTFESTGVIVELDSIETTVAGQFVDATTNTLVNAPVTVEFQGADSDAVIDMYSNPLQEQTIRGGATSFGLQNGLSPTPNRPARLRMTINAEGYQPTSKTVELYSTGTTSFTAHLLPSNPNNQPEGASGVRDQSAKTTADGVLAHNVNVQTAPSAETGGVHLHMPKGTRVHDSKSSGKARGNLTVDLIHYPPEGEALKAFPGNGALETGSKTTRFGVAGYMKLRMQNAQGTPFAGVQPPTDADSAPRVWVHLPNDAVHPNTGEPLRAGDELELYRYNPSAGTWTSHTTVTVRKRGNKAASSPPSNPKKGRLAITWTPWSGASSNWWAWGAQSSVTCSAEARVSISSNGQTGSLQTTLHRPGHEFRSTVSVDDAEKGTVPVSQIGAASTLPQASDYTLELRTPDGESVTMNNVNPCSGTYSATLPPPPPTPRTKALFRAFPECPGDQKVRITSLPTLTVYYREQNAPAGTAWQTVGDERITWVMDDPESPTYVKAAELRLDGIKQDTRYEMFTTYGGDRYEAAERVPSRDDATIEEDRVVVTYSQDFSHVCS